MIVSQAAGIKLKFIPYKGGKPATLAGLQGEVDITGGGVHEHVEFIRAGKLRNLHTTSAKTLDVGGGMKLRSIGDIIPSLKPVLPIGGIYNFAIQRNAPVEVMKTFKKAFIKAVHSKNLETLLSGSSLKLISRRAQLLTVVQLKSKPSRRRHSGRYVIKSVKRS